MKGWSDQINMHFVDDPFLDEGYKSENFPIEENNATWAIDVIMRNLRNA
jgi:hypothetical protein